MATWISDNRRCTWHEFGYHVNHGMKAITFLKSYISGCISISHIKVLLGFTDFRLVIWTLLGEIGNT